METDTEHIDESGGQLDAGTLTARLSRAKRLNAILGVVILFLVIVVISQQSLHAVSTAAGKGTSTAAGKGTSTAASTGASGSAASAQATPGASKTPSIASRVARNKADDTMAWGAIDAPVLMVEWTDFRCPFCAVFSTTTLPTLYSSYIDAGKLRLEVHDAAFFGDQSVDAAVAARAAGAQGKYREYMTVLYAAAPSSGHPDLPREKLVGFAQQAGVPDIAAFTAALDDKATRTLVTTSTTTAQQLGVTGVPFFVIGNQVVSGAQPLASFQSAIDTELANS